MNEPLFKLKGGPPDEIPKDEDNELKKAKPNWGFLIGITFLAGFCT